MDRIEPDAAGVNPTGTVLLGLGAEWCFEITPRWMGDCFEPAHPENSRRSRRSEQSREALKK